MMQHSNQVLAVKLSPAPRAAELRVPDHVSLCIKVIVHEAAAKGNLTTFTRLRKPRARVAIYDRNKPPLAAGRASAPLAESPATYSRFV